MEEAPAAPKEAPAEILPPWLAEEKAAPEEAPAEGLPPWLAEEKAAAEEAPAEGLPPWLAVEEAPAAPKEAPAEILPPWLAEEKAAPEEAPAEGLPPWLAEEKAAAEEAPAEGLPPWLAVEEAPAAPKEAPAEILPPWPAEDKAPPAVGPVEAPAEVAPVWPAAEEAPVAAAEPQEAPEWLGGLEGSLPSWLAAEGQEAAPEEEAGLPSWLTGEGPEAAAPPEARPKEEVPPWPAEEVPAAMAPEPGLPSWLEEAAPAEEAPAIAPEAGLPPWLEEAAPAEEVPAAAPEAGLPPWLEEPAPAEEVSAIAPEAGLPPWLEEAAPLEAGPKEEAPPWRVEEVPAAVAPEAGLPSWLEEPAPAEAGPKEEAPPWPVEEVPAAAPEAGLPSWPEEAAPVEAAAPPEEPPVEPAAAPVLWSQIEAAPVPPPGAEGRAVPVAPEEEEGLPDWARALRPAEEAPAPREGESFLSGVELPEWLRAEERAAVAEEPAAEAAGEMDWLDRLVKEEVPEEAPSLAAIERLPRPALPPLSPARRRAAEVFAGLLAVPEPVVEAKPQPLSTAFQRVLRWLAQRWPMLALAALMVVMVTVSLPLPETPVPSTAGVREAFDAVGAVAGQPGQAPAVVLVAYDWDVQRSAEMRPLALALTAHLMKLQARIIAVSTTFQGNQLAQEVKDEALRELRKDPDFVDDGSYADDKYGAGFLNLSMRTGGESALRLLGSQPISQTFPADFVYGRASGEYPLVQRVRSLEEVALLVVMAGEEDRVVAWMEQVCARPPSPRPCVLVVPTELSPLVEPYKQARRISPAGVLWGLPTVVEYEARLEVLQGISVNRDVSLQQRLHLLTVAEIGLVVLIILGNLAQIGAWLIGLRKGSSRA